MDQKAIEISQQSLRTTQGHSASAVANKPLPVLLSSLQEHFPDLFSMPVVSFGPDPTEATTKSAITKGYRKALLKVHPDRMHSVQPQQKITAEKVFAIIHGSFQSWRNSC